MKNKVILFPILLAAFILSNSLRPAFSEGQPSLNLVNAQLDQDAASAKTALATNIKEDPAVTSAFAIINNPQSSQQDRLQAIIPLGSCRSHNLIKRVVRAVQMKTCGDVANHIAELNAILNEPSIEEDPKNPDPKIAAEAAAQVSVKGLAATILAQLVNKKDKNKAVESLNSALGTEKDTVVKIYLVSAAGQTKNESFTPALMNITNDEASSAETSQGKTGSTALETYQNFALCSHYPSDVNLRAEKIAVLIQDFNKQLRADRITQNPAFDGDKSCLQLLYPTAGAPWTVMGQNGYEAWQKQHPKRRLILFLLILLGGKFIP